MTKKPNSLCPQCNQRKASRYCERLGFEICTICCGTSIRLQCPPYCSYFKKLKKPNMLIKGASFTPGDRHINLSIPSDEYIPQIFMLIEIEIIKFQVDFTDTNSLKVTIVGRINEMIPNILDNLYLKEEWKKELFEFDVKENDFIAPIFSIFHDRDMYILNDDVNFQHDGIKDNVIISPNKNFLILPESYPRCSGLPKGKDKFVMFYGNQTIIYGNPKNMKNPFSLEFKINKLGKSYNSERRNFGLNFFITIPFFNLILRNFDHKEMIYTKLNNSSKFCILSPFVRKELSGYENGMVFPPPEDFKHLTLSAGERNEYSIQDIPKDVDIAYMNTFGFNLKYDVDEEEVLFSLNVTKDPIPISLYEYFERNQIISLPVALIHITNTKSTPVQLIIESSIDNVTEISTQTINIDEFNQESLELQPILKIDRNLPNETFISQFKIKISLINKGNNTIIFEESKKLRLLPENSIIWEIELPNGTTQNLYHYIAIWVTPNDASIEDSISKILNSGKITEFFGYDIETEEELEKQIEAIYSFLNGFPIQYVKQQMSLGSKNPLKSQRIHFPKDTLLRKYGNCLDLSVLFASFLERIEIDSEIIFIEGHAFIGWKRLDNSKVYLECTCLGKQPFKEALEVGSEIYETYFKNSPYGSVVNIKQMRDKGINPLITNN